MQNHIKQSWIIIGLRFSFAAIFLSAVADRFGMWSMDVSAWGNWESFVTYTYSLNPWFPKRIIPLVSGIVTFLEIALSLLLILNYKVKQTAFLSSILLFLFVFAMSLTIGVKSMLDYGVLPLAFSAMALFYFSDKK